MKSAHFGRGIAVTPASGSRRAMRRAMSMVALAALAACGGNDDDDTPGLLATQGTPAAACTALNGTPVDAARIGLPTTGAKVTSTALVAATATGNANGEYCLVRGAIHPVDATAPDILFELNIPTTWNHRALQMGGGGYNGTVVTGLGFIGFAPMATTPLAQGYATYGSDSGHESTAASPSADASFALNAEALTNYGYAHLKKTHDTVAQLLQAWYGSGVAYKNYFAGASTGGRESLTVVQRFPADYDGAYAASPTASFWGIRMIGLPVGRASYATAGGYVNPAKQALVFSKSVAACDALDGVADGIVSNLPACQAIAATTLASLRCAGGADLGDTCLSDPQIAVVNTLHNGLTLPYKLANDTNVYPGYNALEGADFSNNASTLGLGSSGTLLEPPTTTANGYLFAQATQWLRFFVTQNASYNPLTFDVTAPGVYQQRIVDLSSIIGANDPDLSAFQARGGKLILMQGAADTAVSPNATIDYYNRVVAKLGKPTLDSFMRFYQVPGFGHGVGVYVPSWDALAALDAWVTNGTAPGTLASSDTNTATRGRTRPFCVYPAYPKYNGSGDPNAAASFSCT